MTRYLLSEAAEQDLDELVEFVAADSIEAARRLLEDINGALLQLAAMPRTGHVRTDLAENDVRFWVVHSYLIVYRAEVTPIEVLRILSGYRDLVDLLR